MTEEPTVVHEFEIKRGTIRASVSHFRGAAVADVRLWIEPSPGAPLIPTKKGLSLPAEYVDDLQEAVAALAKATHGSPRARARSDPLSTAHPLSTS